MLLLDSCVLIWLDTAPDRVSPAARLAISVNPRTSFVSVASALEIAIKAEKRKLTLPAAVDRWFPDAIAKHGLNELDITSAIAIHAAQLPRIHDDPFDRLIIASAQLLGLTILTPDQEILRYPGTTVLW